MAYDRALRYSIETINIYYKNASDMVIIGSFNDPHGPRKECGHPYLIQCEANAENIGIAIQEVYSSCLHFTQDNLFQSIAPYTQATGEKSWTKFAKARRVIHIEWHKNGVVNFELWKWLPDGGFGPDVTDPKQKTVNYMGDVHELGNAVLSIIDCA